MGQRASNQATSNFVQIQENSDEIQATFRTFFDAAWHCERNVVRLSR
jgi:hypothetical protein